MHDAQDFSLPIEVVAPERAVDDHAPTRPYPRAPLPGVDLRSAEERRALPHPTMPEVGTPEPAPLPPVPVADAPLAARARMRSRVDLTPPPTPLPRAEPLSDAEERRMMRRARGYRRQAWAQELLRRFNFEKSR
jgi:hypothetical protein